MTLLALALADSCEAGATAAVIPVDIAAAKALAAAAPVTETEAVDLLAANGRVLAASAAAMLDLPPFAMSAMDGYAVRVSSLTGQGPWRLPVTARIAAGDSQTECREGAARIMTGGMVPDGFDAVIMQEQCSREGVVVAIRDRPMRGRNIRRAGEDVRQGERLLQAGDLISPGKIALLAGQGFATVDVRRKVRIGLISTGNELREPGCALLPGQIFNSNRLMLRASLDTCRWDEVLDFGIVRDTREAIAAALSEASTRCDAIITTGGVSAGEEDHVSSAVDANGGTFDVLKVAMRPGKPVKVGRIGRALFIGLPGNPNAALVTFRMIAFPALRKIAGMSRTGPSWTSAVADFRYEKRLGRTEFVPVHCSADGSNGLPRVTMLGRGSSASLRSIAEADGIAMLPPDIANIAPGERISFEAF